LDRLSVDLETDLVPVVPGLAAALFGVVDANRAHLREWLSWVDSTLAVKDIAAFIHASVEARGAGLAYDFVIERAGEPVGVISLNRIDAANLAASIGYWLARDWQGRGIVTAACSAVVDFGFTELQLNRIVLAAAVGNARSRRVAERLGFVHEGTNRDAQWLNNRFVDHERYAVLRGEWELMRR
jgi:ribosomal-protein-serine acetyltransferase